LGGCFGQYTGAAQFAPPLFANAHGQVTGAGTPVFYFTGSRYSKAFFSRFMGLHLCHDLCPITALHPVSASNSAFPISRQHGSIAEKAAKMGSSNGVEV
jgi:hypothetical protein